MFLLSVESNIERWRRAVEHDEKELNETKESAEEMSELMSKMQEELDEQKKQRDSLKKDLADVDEEIVKVLCLVFSFSRISQVFR